MEERQKKIIFLKGKKVNLRPLRKATDFESCLRWINDCEVNQYLATYLPMSEQKEEEWFDKTSKSSDNIVFAIEVSDVLNGGMPIGLIGLHNINWKDRTAVTGAVIGEKEYWNQGYGTDAKMLILEYAFNTLNLHKICSSVVEFNKRSLQYNLHCGYKLEGTERKQVFKRGRYWDKYILGVFKNDWLPVWRTYQKTGKVKEKI
ncbi:MAG: GNAT family N-acetyltransferase [Candidatus Lloydbacteria bacterium]|nr:GNAT family N-acetyltransferase [Candidatus Lloydbacteria bacterium]